MSIKTEYNEVTLKELVNLNCFAKQLKVQLHDYDAPVGECGTLTDIITLDEIPEEYGDWYVEYISSFPIKINSVLRECVISLHIRNL